MKDKAEKAAFLAQKREALAAFKAKKSVSYCVGVLSDMLNGCAWGPDCARLCSYLGVPAYQGTHDRVAIAVTFAPLKSNPHPHPRPQEAKAQREASRQRKEENRKASDLTVAISSATAKKLLKSKKGRKQIRTA